MHSVKSCIKFSSGRPSEKETEGSLRNGLKDLRGVIDTVLELCTEHWVYFHRFVGDVIQEKDVNEVEGRAER